MCKCNEEKRFRFRLASQNRSITIIKTNKKTRANVAVRLRHLSCAVPSGASDAPAQSLHLAMVLGSHIDEMIYAKQCRSILHHVLEHVLQMQHHCLRGLLIQRGERHLGADLREQPQQMERTVEGAHRFVRVLLAQLRILRPFELVQQLAAEHHIEVLQQTLGEAVYRQFLVSVQRLLATLLVRHVRCDDVLHGLLGRQLNQLLLAIDCVPLVHQPRLQVVVDFDFDLDFGVELLLGFSGRSQIGRSNCGDRGCGGVGGGGGGCSGLRVGVETGAFLPAA